MSILLRLAAAFVAVTGLWLCLAEASTWQKVRMVTPAEFARCETSAATALRHGLSADPCDATIRSPVDLAGLLPGLGLLSLALFPLWMAAVLDHLAAIRRQSSPKPSVVMGGAMVATDDLAEAPNPQ